MRATVGVGTTLVAMALAMSMTTTAALAQPEPGPILRQTTLFTAHPDRCFSAIGATNPLLTAGQTRCPPGFRLDVRQNYAWSIVRSGDWAYMGTGPQTLCVGGPVTLGFTTPFQTSDNVCEVSQGPYAPFKGAPSGDANPPQVVRYNVVTNVYQDITPLQDPNFQGVLGLRGAASSPNGVVLYFAQVVNTSGAVTGMAIFAWNGNTGQYLGSKVVQQWSLIRKGAVVNNVLYLGARKNPGPGGNILRYTGSISDPFEFTVVGDIANDAFYISPAGDHLVVGGGPTTLNGEPDGGVTIGGPAGIWWSPAIPAGGLTSANTNQWTSVFSWAQFDPDPVVANVVYWGDLAFWNDCVYVGNYRYDGAVTAAKTLWKTYGRPNTYEERVTDLVKSLQGVQYFRICNVGKQNQSVRLLYGDLNMNVRLANGTWTTKPNLLGQSPLFGPRSFDGSPFEIYNWTMVIFQGKLYVAPANAAGFAPNTAPLVGLPQVAGPQTPQQAAQVAAGAQLLRTAAGGGRLWRFDSPDSPAVLEKSGGFGNINNHGIRTFLPFEDKGFLLAGTGAFQRLSWPGNNASRPIGATHGGYSVFKFTPGRTQAPINPNLPAFIQNLRAPIVGEA